MARLIHRQVKLTLTCAANLKADVDRYAALPVQTYVETVDAVAFIPLMLKAFMAADRGFRRASVPPKRNLSSGAG
ncbi:DUF2274 domain-containing protein [Burkholderia pseudomallei]|uniref:DUF2274 domain-containing protein n=1 Tax=Burkholderia pseudomallei TaxID=28450 RepID=UPI000E6A2405|nr:DUF2274 domain-containing protein [Burkholderia pseudomallei]RIV48817.1 DUF2274 domain-containing protein [Burkholderia pseudomallei]RIV63799.1 DUF2274 domain-containing protein [Burkholderia pseudomallei]